MLDAGWDMINFGRVTLAGKKKKRPENLNELKTSLTVHPIAFLKFILQNVSNVIHVLINNVIHDVLRHPFIPLSH